MAEWTNIPDSALEPDAPARSVDALAFRDNPIAIAQRAAGAPIVRMPTVLILSPGTDTWVVPDGVTRLWVFVVGGGGPGGGLPNRSGTPNEVTSGGCGGAVAFKLYDVEPGQSFGYNIQNAITGNTSDRTGTTAGFAQFGDIRAGGGRGGRRIAINREFVHPVQGGGGELLLGSPDLWVQGQDGGFGQIMTDTLDHCVGGHGGAPGISFLFSGQTPGVLETGSDSNQNGNAGRIGAGGGGCAARQTSLPTNGGDGGPPGVIILY